MHSTPNMERSFLEYHKAFTHRMAAWQHEVLFSWQWWLGIVLTILPWVIWLMFRKKECTDRLLYAGIYVGLVSVTLDNIGVQLSLWNYLKPVTPAIPSYIPYDFALMPVTVMFLIQLFYTKRPWVVGLFYGLLVAFVGEPLFRLMGIYEPVKWQHIYSAPFYWVIYCSAHKLATRRQVTELD